MRTLALTLLLAFTHISFADQICRTDWFDATVTKDAIVISNSTFSELNDAVAALGLTFPLRFDRQEYVCYFGQASQYCESGMYDNGRIFLELRDTHSTKFFSQLFKCR